MARRPRWVFLADPTDYGWDQLVRDGRTRWDGIKGSQAQRNLRKCQLDDPVVIYHTAPDKALVGAARVASEPRPDPKHPERVVVDVEAVVKLGRPLPLAELRQDAVLKELGFVRMPRVAVQPITAKQWDRIMQKSGTDPGTAAGADPGEAGGP